MQQNVILKAKKRESKIGKGALNKMRKAGILPGVVYGANIGSFPITVEKNELLGILSKHGSNVIISLDLEGKTIPAMVKEIQHHPVTGMYWHVDLHQISLNRKVRTEVPVVFTGEPQGVKKGGVIQYGDTTVEIECLPADIPENISVDISELGIGEKITVADLTAVDKVEILSDPETIVVTILAPRMEGTEEEEASEEGEATSETQE